MKFGKRIRSEAVASWSPFYIDYKELKHLLKQLVAKVCRESFSVRWRSARTGAWACARQSCTATCCGQAVLCLPARCPCT